MISGKQLATLNDHIRQLSELSNSELDYVRNELSKELNIDVNENMPASMFNKSYWSSEAMDTTIPATTRRKHYMGQK